MPKSENVISALPLLADALGRKRGVRVFIGGDRAFTEGKNIHMPSLPLNAGDELVNLARGWLDHESAHLRLTNFDALKKAKLTPIEKHIWNIIEDYAVERDLAAIYPGCRQNFLWLIRHVFLKEGDNQNEIERPSAEQVLDWLLISLRSLAEPELDAERNRLEAYLNRDYPKLLPELEPLVVAIPQNSADTVCRIAQAKRITQCLKAYAESELNLPAQNSYDGQSESAVQGEQGQMAGGSPSSESGGNYNITAKAGPVQPSPAKSLSELLADPSALQDRDIGTLAGSLLEGASKSSSSCKLTVAESKPSWADKLGDQEIAEIMKKTIALRTRICALLQSKVFSRNQTGRSGRVNSRLLSRLFTANPRVFSRTTEHKGLNTLVWLLLDASASMRNGERIRLACQACFAVAQALVKIPGVSVGATSFPNGQSHEGNSWATVGQILSPKEKLHHRFAVPVSGNTPMAEALWWLLQQMQNSKEARKIVLILSDGVPDSPEETQRALETHRASGHEVCGIGIATQAMSNLLGARSRAVYDLEELPLAMFDMLQGTLLKQAGVGYGQHKKVA